MRNWTNIYIEFSPIIRGVCKRYLNDVQLAEDMTQEAFATAIQKVDDYFKGGSLKAWIRTIAINKCLEYLRNRKIKFEELKESNNSEEIVEEVMSSNPKHIILSTDYSQEELLFAISQLPGHHRDVFNMYVIDKISHKEISERLNISLGTSKSHLSRARTKVQGLLLELAKTKVKEKKNRKGIFFLLPLGLICDRMFAQGLSNYKLPSNQEVPEFIKKTNDLKNLPQYKLTNLNWVFIAIAVLIIGGSVLLNIDHFSINNKPIELREDKVNYIDQIEDSNENFTLKVDSMFSNQSDSIVDSIDVVKKEKSKKAEATVQVRKKVILVKDTVYKAY